MIMSSFNTPESIDIYKNVHSVKIAPDGFPYVGKMDSDFPVKFNEYAQHCEEMNFIRLTIGNSRAIYEIVGFNLEGMLIMNLMVCAWSKNGETPSLQWPRAISEDLKNKLTNWIHG
jgi:hypothetical protein